MGERKISDGREGERWRKEGKRAKMVLYFTLHLTVFGFHKNSTGQHTGELLLTIKIRQKDAEREKNGTNAGWDRSMEVGNKKRRTTGEANR